MLKNLRPNKKPEDKRIPKEEKEELTKLKSYDLPIFKHLNPYLFKDYLIRFDV